MGHQIHPRSDAGQLRQQIEHAGIHPRPRAEAAFEVGVGRNLARPSVVWQKPPHCNPGRQGQGQAENERVPIGRIGLARQCQKADAAEVGGEDRKPAHPAGQRTPRRREALGRAALAIEVEADRHRAREIGRQDDPVNAGEMRPHARPSREYPDVHRDQPVRCGRVWAVQWDLSSVKCDGSASGLTRPGTSGKVCRACRPLVG
jgi:hypothetical protein